MRSPPLTETIVVTSSGEKPLPRLQVSSVDLAEDDIDWLKAVCNLSGISVRAQVTQIIQSHLARNKPQYRRKIAYIARKYGLTFEEAFAQLQTKSPPLGKVVDVAPVREDEEFPNIGTEVSEVKESKEADE
jgi:hypothetical protein